MPQLSGHTLLADLRGTGIEFANRAGLTTWTWPANCATSTCNLHRLALGALFDVSIKVDCELMDACLAHTVGEVSKPSSRFQHSNIFSGEFKRIRLLETDT